MSSDVQVALIGVLGLLIAASLPFIIQGVRGWRSRRFRQQHDVPDILGAWDATWVILHEPSTKRSGRGKERGNASADLYTEDTVELHRWRRTPDLAQFEGVEHGVKKEPDGIRTIEYQISGEISHGPIVSLNWRHENYPSQRHMGSAILNLSTDGRKMAGFWVGFTQEGTMARGSVTLVRRTDGVAKALHD